MKSFIADFNVAKNSRSGWSPVWILKCPFATGTAYLSDMAFPVLPWSGVTTLSWIREWGRIDEDIAENMSLTKVSDFSLRVLVDQQASSNIETILNNAANNIETTDIELYLWFKELTQPAQAPQRMWVGNIVDYKKLDELTYELSMVDISVRLDRNVGTLLDTDTYPRMDPADVGKVGNIVMGDCDNVPCHCILAGGVATLTSDITSTSPGNGGTLNVDDSSQFPPSGTFYVQIGDEIIACTGGGGATYLRCASSGARGAQSTVAAAHSADDPVVEIPSAYAYLVADNDRTVADNGVVVVDTVRVDGALVTDGVTVITSGGIYVNNKTVVTLTHGPVNPDPESISPRGTTFSGATNPGNAIDGDAATACTMTALSQFLQVNYPVSTNNSTVITQQIDVVLNVPSTATLMLPTGWTCAGLSTITNTGGTVTRSITKTGGMRSDYLRFTVSSYSTGTPSIYEVGAKKVTAYKINSGGSTSAKVRVGNVVTVHAVTASPSTAHAPDKVIGRLLTACAGWPTGSFYTDAASQFTTKGYKFSVLINEYKTLKSWLAALAFQCRCYFRFANGQAYLLYRPDSLVSDKTITDHMIRMSENFKTTMKIERSALSDVINKINLKYNRDRSQSGDGAYRGVSKGSDSASISRYGEKEKADLFAFDFVRLKSMADDLRAFYIARNKDRKRIVSIEVFLDNCELEFGDAVTLGPLSNLLCEVQKVNFCPGSGRDMRNDRIELVVKEY